MRVLSEHEVTSIIDNDLSWVVGIMRAMFETIGKGAYSLGGERHASHGMRMAYTRDGEDRLFIAMPAYLGAPFDIAGAKWHGPMARVKGSERDSNYLVILNDPYTGVPLTVMAANTLTNFRTAAVSLLAAELLHPDGIESIALVGPGKINMLVARGLFDMHRHIGRVYIKGRGRASAERAASLIKEAHPSVDVVLASSVEDAVRSADIVSINTGFKFDALSDMPIVKKNWAKGGALFLCSAFAHFPDEMIISATVNVCDMFAMYEAYQDELGYPAYKHLSCLGNRFADLVRAGKMNRDDIFDLSEIVSRAKIPPQCNAPILFSSGGLGLEDIALGLEVYRRACDMSIGQELEYE